MSISGRINPKFQNFVISRFQTYVMLHSTLIVITKINMNHRSTSALFKKLIWSSGAVVPNKITRKISFLLFQIDYTSPDSPPLKNGHIIVF